jgi:hypothetical protein
MQFSNWLGWVALAGLAGRVGLPPPAKVPISRSQPSPAATYPPLLPATSLYTPHHSLQSPQHSPELAPMVNASVMPAASAVPSYSSCCCRLGLLLPVMAAVGILPGAGCPGWAVVEEEGSGSGAWDDGCGGPPPAPPLLDHGITVGGSRR